MRHIWSAIILLLAICAELLTATAFQMAIPFTLLATLYLNVSLLALPASVVAAVLLDLAFGRPFPVSVLPFLLTVLIGSLWKQHGLLTSPLLQIVPTLPCVIFSSLTLFFLAGSFSLRILLCHLIGALIFPIIVIILDIFAKNGKFRPYQTANERK